MAHPVLCILNAILHYSVESGTESCYLTRNWVCVQGAQSPKGIVRAVKQLNWENFLNYQKVSKNSKNQISPKHQCLIKTILDGFSLFCFYDKISNVTKMMF